MWDHWAREWDNAGCKLSGEIKLEISWQDTESWIVRVVYRKWHEILIYGNIGSVL